MNTRTPDALLPARRPALRGALAVLAWAALGAAPALAQPSLFITDVAAKPQKTKWDYVPLRPNQRQTFHLYVHNPAGAQQAKVSVALRTRDGSQEVFRSKELAVDGGATDRVEFPAVPAPPAAAPAAPGQPAPPPAGAELAGPSLDYRFVLLDAAGQPIPRSDLPVRLLNPADYLEVPQVVFDGNANQLRVTVQSKADFNGPPAPVDLVLLPGPDRIPGLVAAPRDGAYHRALTGPGKTVVLRANRLEFEKGRARENGLVYLTVDGYARAFTFETTFFLDGGEHVGHPITDHPIVRLAAPRYQTPEAKAGAALEIDNADPETSLVEVGLDRDNDKEFADDEVQVYPSPRERHLFAQAAPNGTVTFTTQVREWHAELDTAGTFGERTLRLRVLERATKPGQANEAVEILDARRLLENAKPERAVFYPITFDSTPPEIASLGVVLGQRTVGGKPVDVLASATDPAANALPRGKPLRLVARADDPESHIAAVTFFLGKPTADGRIPDAAPQVEGAPASPADRTTWRAELPVPTDRAATLQVSAQVTNGAGAKSFGTIEIRLVDAPPPPPAAAAAAKAAALPRIEGKVLDLGDRAQPNVKVNLTDDKGTVKDTVVTTDAGEFVFRDVAPGSYKVTAARAALGLTGETPVQVVAGENRTGVTVRLRLR